MSSDSDSDPCVDVSKHMNKCLRNFHETYTKVQNEKPQSEEDSLLEEKHKRIESPSKALKQQEKIEENICSGSKILSEKSNRDNVDNQSLPENETNNVLSTIMSIFKTNDVCEVNISSDENLTPSSVATRTRSRARRKQTVVEDLCNDALKVTKRKRQRKVAVKLKQIPIATVELSDEEIIDQNPLVKIKIEWRSTEEKIFEVKKLDTLQTIFDYYVNTYEVKPALLFFSINNKEINLQTNSYTSLRLTEDSVIEGGSLPETYLENEGTVKKKEEKLSGVKFKVQYDRNKSFDVFIKPEDKMDILYSQVIKETNLPLEKFKLLFDGEVVKHTDDIKGLRIEEGEVFDVFLL